MLGGLWRRFRGLPVWVQAVLWLVAWPLLAALAQTSGPVTGRWRLATAIGLLLVGTPVWAAVVTGVATGGEESPSGGDIVATARQPDQPEPEGPDPELAETDLASALAAELAGICAEALDADNAVAAEALVRDAVSQLATDRHHESAEIRAAVDVLCGEQLQTLAAAPAEPEAQPDPGPEPELEPEPDAEPAGERWTVVRIIDGDTVEVHNGSHMETVRVIGIDTPERGECGFHEASDALARMVLDRQVNLTAGARDDRDRYGWLLRYLDLENLDAGLALIEQGLAVARYDSRDGYGRHPREDVYVAADAATAHRCDTVTPAPGSPQRSPGPGSGPGGVWKNCTEAREAGAAPVYRGDPGFGPHLDRDGDGIGCE